MFAFRLALDSRGLSARNQRVKTHSRLLSELAKGRVELDFESSSRAPIVERAVGDVSPDHLFETNRLRAKLNTIRAVSLRFSALVLHRKHETVAHSGTAVELYDISNASETKSCRAQWKSSSNTNNPSNFISAFVRLPMK